MDTRCASCGSTRLIDQTKLATRDAHPAAEVILHTPPSGPLGLFQFKSEVTGRTCVDCGHLQFHAVDLAGLLEVYVRQQAQHVKFDG